MYTMKTNAAEFSIIRQVGTSHVESRVASHYAMTAGVPIADARFEALDAHKDAIASGLVLPVGSVEFVRKAMEFAGISEPENLTYPRVLAQYRYLKRNVRQCQAGSVSDGLFVKPVETKAFTGYVVMDFEKLSEHDFEQHEAFLSLPHETLVWTSTPVAWVSEVRYYVLGGKVVGEGRYDDGEDNAPLPDESMVAEMASLMALSPGAPAAFSLDVGVLDTGETALVECNDAWALGYYKGTLSHRDYMDMLWHRWRQLFSESRPTAAGIRA